MAAQNEPFYLRYYSGHSGRFGHEFLEFDFRALGDGRSAAVRYANNSNYRNDSLIRKEMCVSALMVQEIKRIIKESEIIKEDDSKWPQKNKDGRQELEIRFGNEHISFETAKIGSLVDVTESADPEGLRVFYYLVQDLKALVFSLISLHFKPPMPTPSDTTPRLAATIDNELAAAHTTCPPDVDRWSTWRNLPGGEDKEEEQQEELLLRHESEGATTPMTTLTSPTGMAHAHSVLMPADADPMRVDSEGPTVAAAAAGTGTSPGATTTTKQKYGQEPDGGPASTGLDGAGAAGGRLSPAGEPSRLAGGQQSAASASSVATTSSSTAALLSYEFSNVRLLPNYTSSFLRPGSKFTGTQQSDRQVYNVDVEIKHVDMAESYLCGYLRIQGLTEDHPTLTTFFEGEIIGTKHTFKTRHDSWGATEKTDMNHWARFPAWRPLARQAKKPDFTYRDFAQRDHIFMRWKEYFLVPDHRVRTISGASFEGFYYICFNQIEGTVTGIYFHAKSEKYQQLELKHVEDHGCTPALEFR